MFNFEKHLAGTTIGLIDYMMLNPLGLEILPSEHDKEFVKASVNSFFTYIELIDNVILNTLTNRCERARKK